MGEFSEAFNTMTRQLRDRQEKLEQEKKRVERKNEELQRNLELVMTLMNFTHNMIFAYSTENEELLFSNEAAQWFCEARPETAGQVLAALKKKKAEKIEPKLSWEFAAESRGEGDARAYFGIESHRLSWWGKKAVVHIVSDDTERRQKENLMYEMAYIDPLTGLNNRRYAMDRMETLVKEKTPFVISFVDIDCLKYCNDTYGHKTGDEYLMDTSEALLSLGAEVCRIGGDEFILLQTGMTEEEQNARLEYLRNKMQENYESRPYPVSFSYASSEVPAAPDKPLEDYIRHADSKMYWYKMAHRKPLRNAFYEEAGSVTK